MGAERWRLLAGLMLSLCLLAPLVPLAIWSVAHGWRFPDLLPRDWTLAPWRLALSSGSGVLSGLAASALVAAGATALGALAAVPAGRALGLMRFRGRGLVFLLVLAPALVPAIAIAPGLHAVFLRLGLAGTLPGVILAHLIPVLPYMTLVMATTFARFDPAHEAQARSLGAGPVQVFAHVTLPAILPGLVTAALFGFLVSWSQYLLTLVIGAGQVQTLPLVLYSFAAAGRNDMTGAIAILSILPGLVLVAFSAWRLGGRPPGVQP